MRDREAVREELLDIAGALEGDGSVVQAETCRHAAALLQEAIPDGETALVQFWREESDRMHVLISDLEHDNTLLRLREISRDQLAQNLRANVEERGTDRVRLAAEKRANLAEALHEMTKRIDRNTTFTVGPKTWGTMNALEKETWKKRADMVTRLVRGM